jgi:hypothetical protein
MEQTCIRKVSHDRHESIQLRVRLGNSSLSSTVQSRQPDPHDVRKAILSLATRTPDPIFLIYARTVAGWRSGCKPIRETGDVGGNVGHFDRRRALTTYLARCDQQSEHPDRAPMGVAAAGSGQHAPFGFAPNPRQFLPQRPTGHSALSAFGHLAEALTQRVGGA